MTGSTIVGLGCQLPDRVVASEEIADLLGVSADWIHTRTGIRRRHLAGPDESVVDLAAGAAERAVAGSGLSPASIGAVIVATCTGDRMPSTAAEVAGRLGLHCVAFNVNAACAGFCQALAVADSLIQAGAAGSALVIGADKASGSIDWCDRNTAPLFGDGAGALVLQSSPNQGVGPSFSGSQGEQAGLIRLNHQTIRQIGPTVFRWAIGLGEHVRAVCDAAGVKPRDVAAFIPHQANLRIVDALAADLDAPDAVIARDVIEVGNTMAASIPIALARMAQRRELPVGQPVVLFGFGSGLAYAGQTVLLDRDLNAATP